MGGLLLLLLSLGQPAAAQEDAYHAGLRSQLQTDYGVTGGTWVLGDTEDASFQQVFIDGDVTREDVAVTGQPFTQAIRFTVNSRSDLFWQRGAYLPVQAPIQAGDAVLLVVWLRGLTAERGHGAARSLVGENQSPFRTAVAETQVLDADWQQWLIPFEASLDLPLGRGQYGLQMGYMEQTFELGGLALLNYGSSLTVDDLPRSTQRLDYAGRDAGAAWRADAATRIEQNRKGDLAVRVVDQNGNAVAGAEVEVSMQQHAFGFGTAVSVFRMLGTSADDALYRQRINDLTGDGRSFNYAVIENGMKWPVWEGQVSWFPFSQAQTTGVVEGLLDQGMRVRGHTLVWPSWGNLPPDLEQNQNDLPALRQRVETHIQDMTGNASFQGQLVAWDVLNEPAHLFDLENAFGSGGIYEEYADWFNLAAQTDPDAALYINDYGIISGAGLNLSTQDLYKAVIEGILAAGGSIDGIGIQGHVQAPLAAPETVYAILDEFAALVPNLSITEYDAQDVPEDLAADYIRDLLTIVFSHPAAESFLVWGFWDGSHWLNDAPLFRQDWSLKPSGQAFLDLVFDEWWTDVQSQTDAEGSFATRGFLGEYAVTTRVGQATSTSAITLTRDGATVELTLDLTATNTENATTLPDAYALSQNYPNPFNPSTQIRFALPQAGPVRLTVFDVLGREVAVLVDSTLPAGTHEATFDAAQLPSGVYLYQLETGDQRLTRTMLLMK